MNNTTLPNSLKNIIKGSLIPIFALLITHSCFAEIINHSTKNAIFNSFGDMPFAPGISITVDGTHLDGLEGSPGCNLVLYEITVTNTGTDDLENVVVSDALLEGIIRGPTESLNPYLSDT